MHVSSQILLCAFTSGKKALVQQKVRYEYHPFPLPNPPRAATLNLHDVVWLSILLRSNFPLYATIWATVPHHRNSKQQHAGNPKAKIGGIYIQLLDT